MATDAAIHHLPALWETALRSPFHRGRLKAAGQSGVPLSLEAFQAGVPFTTKADLVADQASHGPYGTLLTEPLTRYTRCHQTSGTTGVPLRWLDTPESWEAMVRDWETVLRAAGVGAGDRILFAFSFGPFLGFWLAFEAGQRLGALCFAGGGMSSAVRVRLLLENECTVLCCTPTYGLHLSEVATAEGQDLSACRIRTLVVAGEPGGSLPAVRSRLSKAWNGAGIFDHHGMTETGPVTYEDPKQPGTLLVFGRSFLAEVLRPETAEPVPAGESGELILTSLQRLASPLIRYRTGDLVTQEAAEPGAEVRLVGGILGRIDDMVIVRGVNVYPAALDEIIRGLPEIAEYRVTLDTRGALTELGLEVEAPPAVAAELAQRIHRQLALRVPIQAVEIGSLPRFDLKARRWRRH